MTLSDDGTQLITIEVTCESLVEEKHTTSRSSLGPKYPSRAGHAVVLRPRVEQRYSSRKVNSILARIPWSIVQN